MLTSFCCEKSILMKVPKIIVKINKNGLKIVKTGPTIMTVKYRSMKYYFGRFFSFF